MQIFEQKSTTKNGISLYSTKYNISKIAARRSRYSVDKHYSVKGSITKRASESVKKRTYNLPSFTYARKADISNTNTCGSPLVESTASIFWYNTTSS